MNIVLIVIDYFAALCVFQGQTYDLHEGKLDRKLPNRSFMTGIFTQLFGTESLATFLFHATYFNQYISFVITHIKG